VTSRRYSSPTMAKVKAAYNYSYNYEGKKISFKKDEEFQLLSKSNNDWWQVRRYLDGAAQDIYVPAVYVKEEKESLASKEVDPTYMNLDDISKPEQKASEAGGGGGGVAAHIAPKVLNKPKNRASIKRSVHPHTQREAGKNKDGEGDSGPTSPTSKANGINLTRPVSPSALRRLNKSFNAGGSGTTAPVNFSSSLGSGVLSAVQRNHTSLATGCAEAARTSGSLTRGEKLNPPTVVKKTRTKTIGDVTNDGANPSMSDRATPGGEGPKGRLPPPIQSKPKPQKTAAWRPISMVSGTEPEVGGASSSGGGGEVGAKPLVSELSNLLLKKNPHLAGGEHRALVGTRSLGLEASSSQQVPPGLMQKPVS